MNDLLAQARAFFDSLSLPQRTALLTALILSLFVVGGVVWWSSAESYDLIMVGDSAELRKAAEQLDEAGIPYRYSAAGTGIEVPTASRGEAMVTAASVGLSGWQDILNTIDMGTSPSVEREYRTRALEAEIQKTLNSLDAIEGSRVHIVPLDRISFIGREKQASASVKVQTATPGALDRAQIRGIVQLVAGAVHGLSANDVTLIDTDGSLLHPDSDASNFPGGRNLDEVRFIREAELQARLQDAAQNILGSRDALWANVNVELATSAIERTSRTYDPEGSVLVSETLREEDSTETMAPAGVPGAQTNLPENAAATAGGGGGQSSVFENTNNYQTSSVDEIEIITPGDIKRVVTSVAVNKSALEPLIANGMTDEQVRENLQKVIQAAVGYDTSRGDELIVEFIDFAPMDPIEETSMLTTLTYSMEGILPWILVGLVLIAFFFGVMNPMINRILAYSLPNPDDASANELERGPPGTVLSAEELLARVRYSLNHELEILNPDDINALVEKFQDPSTTVLRRWMKQTT